MPNRILKDSICRSDSIDQLTWFEEVLFYRLIVACDDYGRFDGRSQIIKGTCFPLKADKIRNKQIEDGIKNLTAAGMVVAYECNGKPFLQLTNWESHQNIRAKKSKYPAFDGTCTQMYADDCRCARNPIQSESNSHSFSNHTGYCPERKKSASGPQPEKQNSEPVVTSLALNTGEYNVLQKDYVQWCELYPGVDVIQQLRSMKAWLDANPKKRKTSQGIKRFIVNWLQKEQDKGHQQNSAQVQKSSAGAAFCDFNQRNYDYDELMREINGG